MAQILSKTSTVKIYTRFPLEIPFIRYLKSRIKTVFIIDITDADLIIVSPMDTDLHCYEKPKILYAEDDIDNSYWYQFLNPKGVYDWVITANPTDKLRGMNIKRGAIYVPGGFSILEEFKKSSVETYRKRKLICYLEDQSLLPGTICRQRIISEIKQKFSIEQINDISKFNQYKIVLCPEATESQGYVSPIFPRVLESGSIPLYQWNKKLLGFINIDGYVWGDRFLDAIANIDSDYEKYKITISNDFKQSITQQIDNMVMCFTQYASADSPTWIIPEVRKIDYQIMPRKMVIFCLKKPRESWKEYAPWIISYCTEEPSYKIYRHHSQVGTEDIFLQFIKKHQYCLPQQIILLLPQFSEESLVPLVAQSVCNDFINNKDKGYFILSKEYVESVENVEQILKEKK